MMENIRFMIRHVERINNALNAIDDFNREIKFEKPLSDKVTKNYKNELASAKSFDYLFRTYMSQFKSSSDIQSVLSQLEKNLKKQLVYLLDKIKSSSTETQMASIQCDLENVKAIMELSEAYCFKEICYTIRNFVQTEQELFNRLCLDFSKFDLMNYFELLAKLKSILVFETLSEKSTDNDFKFLMGVMLEQVKQKFCDSIQQKLDIVVLDSFSGDMFHKSSSKFAYQNIKFMIAHIRLINGSKSAMEHLNEQIANGAEYKECSSYQVQLTNANNLNYSFQLFTYQFAQPDDQNVSVYEELVTNLVDQTAYLLQMLSNKAVDGVKEMSIDIKNLETLFRIGHEFCQDELALCASNYIKMLVVNFEQDLIDLEGYQSVLVCYTTLKKVLVFEGVGEIQRAVPDLITIIDELRGSFRMNLNRCLSVVEYINFKSDEYELIYERTEKSMELLENYASLVEHVNSNPLCKGLQLDQMDRLTILQKEVKIHGSDLKRSFSESIQLIGSPLNDDAEDVKEAKKAVRIFQEVQFAQRFEKTRQHLSPKLLQDLKDELKEALELLEEKIDGLVRCELLSQLPNQLAIAKELGNCEPAFSELYKKYNDSVKTMKRALFDKCCGNLTDFVALKEDLLQFNENEVLDKIFLDQLRVKLNKTLEKELNAAKNIESFEDIAVGLKSLENLFEAKNVRQDFVDDFSGIENDVRRKINHLVHEYVAVAKNLVANLQMSEAEENISRLSDLLKSLNKLRVIDEETQRAITELKCNQKELSVIEKFQEMNLEESLIRIAEVYESLTKYPQSLDEVNKLITNKLKTKLADTSGTAGLKQLHELSEKLTEVPENLKSKLEKLVAEQVTKLQLELNFLFHEAEAIILKFIKHPQNQKNLDLRSQYDRMIGIAYSGELNVRVEQVNAKLKCLVENCVADFESSLVKLEVYGVKNQLNVIRFIMELNGIMNDGSYGRMKNQVVERLGSAHQAFLQTNLPRAENWQRIQFDRFYDELNGQLQVLVDAARLLQECFEVGELNLSDKAEECVKVLNELVEVEFRRAMEKLECVCELEYGDCDAQIVNAFIVCFYNLAAFELKMPKAKSEGAEDYERRLQSIALEKVNQILAVVQESEYDVEKAANTFKAAKELSIKLFVFKEKMDKLLDRAINNFINRSGGFSMIGKLGLLLKSDPVGSVVMSDHKVFESFHRSLFNRKTLSQDIEYVLKKDNLEGDEVDLVSLRAGYGQFKASFDSIVESYLAPVIDFDKLIGKLREIVDAVEDPLKWGANLKKQLPVIIGHLFGLWTLLNATSYFDIQAENSDEQFHFIPHPAQVIAIFRMLGFGYSSTSHVGLAKNLVQIGTGEGKSVTLAITGSTLALFGMDVYCVCYSSYLSQRDYNAFEMLFQKLALVKHINYGTFNKICETVLNSNGDLRKKIEDGVEYARVDAVRRKILLIDEVDVFFSKEFYGNRYQPSLSLRDDCLSGLISMIWRERSNPNLDQLEELTETPEFKSCLERFGSDWEPLIIEAMKDMIYELRTFETGHEYIVQDDQIGYKELDNTVFDISYGYKTLFAYFQENENGRISGEALAKNVSLLVRLGTFSYAEIPKDFDSILGCSGTLSTLSKPEQNIIGEVYQIGLKTTIPSVYGRNNLRFNKQDNIMLEADQNFKKILAREIKDRLVGQNVGTKRAVFVVFETSGELDEFLSSGEYQAMRKSTLVLTETANNEEKKRIVNLASSSGQVTFFTKIFGRGTDFKVHDQIVSVNGGVHVIQTFLSEELSEEIQIKGRTARQGENGSFSMVIPISSLEKFQIRPEDLERHQYNIYDFLNDMRCRFFEHKYAENLKLVESIQQKHLDAVGFLESIGKGDQSAVRQFLFGQNKGKVTAKVQSSRTLILIDATASMGHLLDKTKNTLGVMFERVSQVLAAQSLDAASFQIKLAVYRNYNCSESQLLQQSSWENRPENLIDFLGQIYATGGWGNEAIEVGLWQANQEQNLSQVILIGDAAANEKDEVLIKRNWEKNNRWDRSARYAQAVFWDVELEELIKKSIPIHAFYLHHRAQENFEVIAAKSNGKSEFLDIDSSDASEKLTNLVNIQVLNNIGGDELVDFYRNTYNAF